MDAMNEFWEKVSKTLGKRGMSVNVLLSARTFIGTDKKKSLSVVKSQLNSPIDFLECVVAESANRVQVY